MRVTVDANVLIYATDESGPRHLRALECLERLARGPESLYVFWPVLAAFLRIVTHATILSQPLSSEQALANVRRLLAAPHVSAPGETDSFHRHMAAAMIDAGARGPLVSDAWIAALMASHGVRTIYTADRDFRRFDGIRIVDPFA